MIKSFNILATFLNPLNVLFLFILMVRRKLFSDLYLAKFLDVLAKLFFPCSLLRKIYFTTFLGT